MSCLSMISSNLPSMMRLGFNESTNLSTLRPSQRVKVLCSGCHLGLRCYRFGRKRTMMYYFALKIAGMLMSVFGTNYTVFVLGRFCMGCGHVGYHHPGFVLGNSFFANTKKSFLEQTFETLTTIILQICFYSISAYVHSTYTDYST